MPFYSHQYQREFNWRFQPGTIDPLADVITLGGIAYFKCCPACGCFHPVPKNKVIGPVKLNCTLKQYAQDSHIQRTSGGQLWRRIYDRWLDRWPLAADCQRAYCRVVPLGDEIPRPGQEEQPDAPQG